MNLKNVLKAQKTWGNSLLPCLLFLLCFTTNLQAQEMTVKGVVTGSEDGMPIPGVSVIVKNTSNGVATDFDGNYTISAKVGDYLVFSYLGMTDQTIKVTGSTYNVKLISNFESLEEVVVIGYGTITKKEITGAVAQVKAKEIEDFVTADIASAMQGQIAGVNIVSSSGQPGEESSIQIRGITSLAGSNEPLYVVDGIPQVGNPGISSNEIETIDVLKDAGSTAVYGARGAAGVILITTKRGKDGSARVTLTSSYGIQRMQKGLPLMNTDEQLYFDNVQKFYFNGFIPNISQEAWLNNDNTFTDYVVVENAATQRYDLNLTGGTKDFSYNAVMGYLDQEGQIINSGFRRYNGRFSTTYKTKNWKFDGSVGFTSEKIKKTSTSLFQNAAYYSPLFPKVDLDSDIAYTDGSGGVNTPLNKLLQSIRGQNYSSKDRINTSLSVSRKFGDDLLLTSRLGGAVATEINNVFRPKTTLVDVNDNSSTDDPTLNGVSAEAIRTTKLSWDAILNYNKSFGDHNINVTGSLSVEEAYKESFEASRQGVANNSIKVINGATINPQSFSGTSGINYTKNTVGTLGRIQYNFQRKYLLSVLARYDGSSRFGKDYRWGLFPTISGGWNVSDEDFWDSMKSVVNNFRVRASYGKVGNDSFSDYEFASTLSQSVDYIFDPTDQQQSFGSIVKSYSNEDVKWETSISTNVGVDLGLFSNKLTLSADYYITKKEDMLFPVRLPGSAGAYYDNTLTLNVGNMENSGLELSARIRESIGKSKFNVGLTFSTNENIVTKMEGDTKRIFNSSSNVGGIPVTVLEEGLEAGAFYLYKTDGIIKTQEELDEYHQYPSRSVATLGDLRFVDTNNDGDIDDDDRVYSGSGLPEYEMGFNFNWKYTNWDFSMNWYASLGSEIINAQKREAYNRGRHKDQVNMWTPENPDSNIAFWKIKSDINQLGATDLWLENGDYLRLKLVTLAYNLPKETCSKLGVNDFKIYGSAQNALTITGYDGFEPEIGGNVAKRGIDLDRYPISALYSLGVKLSF
ncbi:SusC/RagA family TonB-linked outer membrane protein [Lutibacter citreus]|uniref:SusC/RagA family TonB-linked outer membrane protein n=1 Tax=Lutibacter citreus TaxID=2138210 RepID=UPI000DBE2608|nr:TonB-dependent receptor [Lutibacter citreus]